MIVTYKNNQEKGVQKYRDIAMRWKRKAELAILACENQNKVHYAMPVRMMIYHIEFRERDLFAHWKFGILPIAG